MFLPKFDHFPAFYWTWYPLKAAAQEDVHMDALSTLIKHLLTMKKGVHVNILLLPPPSFDYKPLQQGTGNTAHIYCIWAAINIQSKAPSKFRIDKTSFAEIVSLAGQIRAEADRKCEQVLNKAGYMAGQSRTVWQEL